MDRYVAATVLQAVGVVLICLVTVVTLFTLVDELRDITPGYSEQHALLYVLYSTPRRAYELLPYAVFIGALVGLGMMASQEELTVFRAAGASVLRLFGAVAAPALLLLLGNQALGEFVAPAGEAAAATLKLRVQRGGQGYIHAAQWHREGDLYTSVEGYGEDGKLVGVRQFRFTDGELRVSRYAEAATFRPMTGDWLLEDVVETRLRPSATSVRRYESLPWRSDANPQTLSAKALFDPAKLSFADLAYQIDYLQREGLAATRYQVSFWNKALQPVAVLGLVLLAVGFVIGPLREVGMGARLAVGVAVGLAFKYLLDVFAPMSIVFGIPPWLAMSVPVAGCWLAGVVAIRRI